MILSTLFSLCVLASTGYVTAAPSPDSDIRLASHTSVTPWVAIRTDEAAWQSACGNERRVGAVCVDAEYGRRNLFLVQASAQQNVVFSARGHYFHAYCPNVDKGESAYTIRYVGEHEEMKLHIVGRTSNQRCCNTRFTDNIQDEGLFECIEPSVISGATFPPNDMFDHYPKPIDSLSS